MKVGALIIVVNEWCSNGWVKHLTKMDDNNVCCVIIKAN